MRILSVGEFDPCGVAVAHRNALRERGIDYRVAVAACWQRRDVAADWVWGMQGDPWALLEFARSADIVQFYPGIGQPWSSQADIVPLLDAETEPWPAKDGWPRTVWSDVVRHARVVYYVHGSNSLAGNIDTYRRRFAGKPILASTIDYAHKLDALYAPPVLDPDIVRTPARLRGEHDPLIVVHAPTDPAICSTEPFVEICRRLGIISVVCTRMPHQLVIRHKVGASVGFDHLRGCFSVNTLENAALGLVPLVGINHEWVYTMLGLPLPPGPVIDDRETLEKALRFLVSNQRATVEWQMQAHHWYHQLWRPAVVDRLVGIYESIADA